MITATEVIKAIEWIREHRHDDAAAHTCEDALYVKVLRAVAEGDPKSQELARAALSTLSISFSRWTS